MQFQAETNQSNAQRPLGHRAASKLGIFTLALLICAAAAADPVPQFGVTAVNAQGNALYNVTLTPNATPNTGALITGTTRLNTNYRSGDAWQVLCGGPCSQLGHQRTRSHRRGLIQL